MIRLPGSTVTVGTANGGVISTGWLIATVGATAVESMRQSRVALRRSACPIVSVAVALPRQIALVRQGHVVGPGRVGGADDVGLTAEAC